jgi:hypothetical protein
MITLLSKRFRLTNMFLSMSIGAEHGRAERISQATIQRVIAKWMPRLGVVGRILTSFKVDADVAKFLMPEKFKSSDYASTYAIGDARDVQTHRVRIDSTAGRMQFSDKVKSAAIRTIVLCAPYGLVMYHSEPCFARATEQTLFAAFAPSLPEFPKDMAFMADRAYKYASGYLKNHNRVYVPDDKESGDGFQFPPSQLSSSRAMSQRRYTIEVVNSRSATWESADDIVSRQDLPGFSNVSFFSYGNSFFMEPLSQPAGRAFYMTIGDALYSAYSACGKNFSEI